MKENIDLAPRQPEMDAGPPRPRLQTYPGKIKKNIFENGFLIPSTILIISLFGFLPGPTASYESSLVE